MVLGAILIAGGLALMVLGIILLGGWLGGKSHWFDPGVYDRSGASKVDRMSLYVTFIAMVLAPLLLGALLIAYGLRTLR